MTKLNAVDNNEYEFSTKEYTAVKMDRTKMNVVLDDGYTLHFEKYIPANHTKKSIKEFNGTYFSQELNTTYTFNSNNNQLIANHQRTGEFKLRAIKKISLSAIKVHLEIFYLLGTSNKKLLVLKYLVVEQRILSLKNKHIKCLT